MSEVMQQTGTALCAMFEGDSKNIWLYCGDGKWVVVKDVFELDSEIYQPKPEDIIMAKEKSNVTRSCLCPVFEKSGYHFIITAPFNI